jgi:hypothetical protein
MILVNRYLSIVSNCVFREAISLIETEAFLNPLWFDNNEDVKIIAPHRFLEALDKNLGNKLLLLQSCSKVGVNNNNDGSWRVGSSRVADAIGSAVRKLETLVVVAGNERESNGHEVQN